MNDDDGNGGHGRQHGPAAADLVARQRAVMAERARLPYWYVGVFFLALLGLLGAPLVTRLVSWQVGQWAVMMPCLAVMLVGESMLTRSRGASFSRRTLLAYPSSRRSGAGLLATVVVGVAAVNVLLEVDLFDWSAAVAVLACAVGTGWLVRHNEAIRRDIRAGRVQAA